MASKNGNDRETAILKALHGWQLDRAYEVSKYLALSSHDSDANGYYWTMQAQIGINQFKETVKEVGGQHVDFILSGFDKLVAAHRERLEKDATK